MMPNTPSLSVPYLAALAVALSACAPEPPLAPAPLGAPTASGAPSIAAVTSAPESAPATASGVTAPVATPAAATALGKAIHPFATYIVGMHNRIHPRFAAYLDVLKDPAIAPTAYVTLEMVLDKRDGRLARVGVIKSSGVPAFDLAAIEVVRGAAPFGPAPDAIASSDGNVHVSWELHRDPVDACTTRNARPFILKTAP